MSDCSVRLWVFFQTHLRKSQEIIDVELLPDDEEEGMLEVLSDEEEEGMLDVLSNEGMDLFDPRLSNKVVLANLHLLLFDMAEGALGWKFSEAVVDADGPSSLVEMLEWPARFRQNLTSDELTHLQRNAACVDMSTRYSGIDTPVYAFACLASDLGIEDLAFQHLYSWEEDKLCREVLCQSSSGSCVFGDMMGVMPIGTKKDVSKLDPGTDSSSLSREAAVRLAYKLILNTKIADRSFCSKHRRDCCCFPTRQKGRLTLEVAGTTCVAFSARGSGQRLAHFPSASVLFMWVRHILATLPLMILHECSPSFPIALLMFLLPLYSLFFSVEACPTMIGYPMRRPRRWSCLLLKGGGVTPRAGARIEQLFESHACRVVVSASEYLVAPDHLLQRELMRLQMRRGAPSLASSDFVQSLPGGMRPRGDTQMLLCSKSGIDTEDVCFDMEQNAGFTSKPVSHGPLPTLTCHGTVWSTKQKRPYIAAEHLLAQGWHVFPDIVPCTAVPAPFSAVIESGDLKEQDLKKMAGNGMHAPWVGMLIGWVLANIDFEDPLDEVKVEGESQADGRLLSRSRSRSRSQRGRGARSAAATTEIT